MSWNNHNGRGVEIVRSCGSCFCRCFFDIAGCEYRSRHFLGFLNLLYGTSIFIIRSSAIVSLWGIQWGSTAESRSGRAGFFLNVFHSISFETGNAGNAAVGFNSVFARQLSRRALEFLAENALYSSIWANPETCDWLSECRYGSMHPKSVEWEAVALLLKGCGPNSDHNISFVRMCLDNLMCCNPVVHDS